MPSMTWHLLIWGSLNILIFVGISFSELLYNNNYLSAYVIKMGLGSCTGKYNYYKRVIIAEVSSDLFI